MDVPSLSVFANSNGWGPTRDTLDVCIPSKFIDKPFAPFSKGDKLGRVADFTSHRRRQKYNRYENEDEMGEETFKTVDTERHNSKNSWIRRRVPVSGGYQRNRHRPKQKATQEKTTSKKYNAESRFNRRKKEWYKRLYRGKEQRSYVTYQSSVKIGADWKMVEQFDLKDLGKLSTNLPEKIDDFKWCGGLEYVDSKYVNMSTKAAKPLEKTSREFYYVTTTDDDNIEELANEGKGNVFATDAIMAHIMTCSRSVRPWDITIQVFGEGEDKIVFFDKREDDEGFDYLTVNETANQPPDNEDTSHIDSAKKLSIEATVINQNFSQQILRRDGKRKEFDGEHPFFDEEEEASSKVEPSAVAYRYRRFHIGDKIKLVARTELNGITIRSNEERYVTTFALNEFEPSTLWRKKLDKQKGAVFATAAKNNSFKVAKWTAQTFLSGANFMKIGYVSRSNFKDRTSHQLLSTQIAKPEIIANLVALTRKNMWAVMRYFVEISMKQEQGRYALVRDPNKPLIRLYKLPDPEEEEEEDDEEEE